MRRPTGYYVRRMHGLRLRGEIIELWEGCETATLEAPPGWHRIPRWLYMVLRPLMDKELRSVRCY